MKKPEDLESIKKNISQTEKKQIRNTLIHSYELLEEKLNLVNQEIDNLKSNLK